jgi:type III pantothenate kinase
VSLLLAIDAGNTNISFALFRDKKLVLSLRAGDTYRKTADDHAVWLLELLRYHAIDAKKVTAAIIASVVPEADYALNELCNRYFNIKPLFVTATLTGLPIALPHPEEVGADRLVNAVAVREEYGLPAIVIDLGTATTFDVVDDTGTYRGGVIAPGLNLSVEALYQHAAKLPRISVTQPEYTLGNTTVSAMQSGVYWGYTGLIKELLTRLRQEVLPHHATVHIIATGGLSYLFATSVPAITAVDIDLTLKGLQFLHAKSVSI